MSKLPDTNLSDVDIRDAFFEQIYQIGKKDKDVIFITDDMDAFGLRKFKRDLPSQFINIGVAEQNMIDVASGLASCGKKVFVYGICSYITMRCFEQIRFSIASMNLPVVIIGVGAGFSFAFDGPTHHGTTDVAIMRTLPEIMILNPSDSALAAASAQISYKAKRPVYIRLDKGKFPSLFDGKKDDFSDGFKVIKEIKDVNIVSTGFMTQQSVKIVEELKKRSLEVGLVDLYRLKPINESLLLKVLGKSKHLIIIEENSIIGGMGSAVAEILADNKVNISLTRFALEDKQFFNYGSRDWLHQLHGLDNASIVEKVLNLKKAKIF